MGSIDVTTDEEFYTHSLRKITRMNVPTMVVPYTNDVFLAALRRKELFPIYLRFTMDLIDCLVEAAGTI